MTFRIYYTTEHFDNITNTSYIEALHPDMDDAKKWAFNEVLHHLIQRNEKMKTRWSERVASLKIQDIKALTDDTH